MGRDISIAFEKFGSDYNRSNSAAQRAETAGKTGIVSERGASLSVLPEYVAKLGPKARVIDASGNTIAYLPDDVGLLVKVHKLNVASNLLTSLPASLCSMTALKVLRLESNKLESLPDGIGSLSKLEELVLADNKLRALPLSVSNLRRLTRLDLSRNILLATATDAEATTAWEKNTEAEQVGRCETDATCDDAAGLRHVGGCTALTELRLEGNFDLGGLPWQLSALKSLKILSADNTGVRRVPGTLLEGCSALHTLTLRGCPIDIEELRTTPGYEGFESRRQANRSKQIHGQVMVGSRGLDDGLDHSQHTKRSIKGAHT